MAKNFYRIHSTHFLIQPGEDEKIINEGMYGLALSSFLQQKLRGLGYQVPFFLAEDWGWWVEIKGLPFRCGLCIYAGKLDPSINAPSQWVIYRDTPAKTRIWSWRRLKYLEISSEVARLDQNLRAVFQSDPHIKLIEITSEMPELDL